MLPPAAADLGEAEAAIELWEHYTGKTLDPTQRLNVCVIMAQSSDGKWAARTTGREMPRQNGKGDEIEVVELWGLVQRAERIAHTIHDAVLLATETQNRMLSVIEGHTDLSRKIQRVWRGTGQQMIEMRNGGTIWYRTRSGGGGRGVDDVDRIVADEAQHATQEQIAAVSPTGFANRNPQLNAFGTGGISGVSKWWWGFRKRALSTNPGAFGYVGHTAETVYLDDDGRVVQVPVDASDRSLWPPANPAIVSGRGQMEFLEEQFRTLPDLFGREHLGVWDPPDDDEGQLTWQVWSKSEWSACATKDPVRAAKPGWLVGAVTLAVEMPPERGEITIAAAGECSEGGVGFDVVARGRGTSWLVAEMVKLTKDPKRPVARVVVDPRSPAGALIKPLTDAGVSVTEIETAAYTKATGDFFDAVLDRDVVHRDSPEINEAVKDATTRRVGDAWLLDRRTGVDISPITASVMARWGHLLGGDKPAGARDYLLVL